MIIEVTPQELHKASQKFLQLSQDYTDVYTRLLNVAQTMGNAWSARDNLAYVEQINGFCDDLKLMAAHLKTCGETLTQQGSNYEHTLEDNLIAISKLNN